MTRKVDNDYCNRCHATTPHQFTDWGCYCTICERPKHIKTAKDGQDESGNIR